MFTGLIETVGEVVKRKNSGTGITFTVKAPDILKDVQTGDSININGACQTVVSKGATEFTFDTIEETVKKTTLGMLHPGDRVNLELSLTPSKKMGGHFVLGHVDTTGRISDVRKLALSYEIDITFESVFLKYAVHVGSIAIDGISLTIADILPSGVKVAIIPHTWENTNLRNKGTGSLVNLEFDILGKYVEKQLRLSGKTGITGEWLKEQGF